MSDYPCPTWCTDCDDLAPGALHRNRFETDRWLVEYGREDTPNRPAGEPVVRDFVYVETFPAGAWWKELTVDEATAVADAIQSAVRDLKGSS